MTDHDTVTIEAEYSLNDSGYQEQFTFDDLTPSEAKDTVVSGRVPFEAELFRIGGWHGGPGDRPESGHEEGFFDD